MFNRWKRTFEVCQARFTFLIDPIYYQWKSISSQLLWLGEFREAEELREQRRSSTVSRIDVSSAAIFNGSFRAAVYDNFGTCCSSSWTLISELTSLSTACRFESTGQTNALASSTLEVTFQGIDYVSRGIRESTAVGGTAEQKENTLKTLLESTFRSLHSWGSEIRSEVGKNPSIMYSKWNEIYIPVGNFCVFTVILIFHSIEVSINSSQLLPRTLQINFNMLKNR